MMSGGLTRDYLYSIILHFIFRPFQLLQSGSIHKKLINLFFEVPLPLFEDFNGFL